MGGFGRSTTLEPDLAASWLSVCSGGRLHCVYTYYLQCASVRVTATVLAVMQTTANLSLSLAQWSESQQWQ